MAKRLSRNVAVIKSLCGNQIGSWQDLPPTSHCIYPPEASAMGNLDKSEAIMFPAPDGVASQKESSTATNGHLGSHEATDPEKLFDSLNQTYSDAYESNAAQVQCIQKLISMLSSGSRVLDIGSGTGLPVASMLTDAGMTVTGIDISSAMIDAARLNVPSANFHKCDMRTYRPLNDEKYDAIVSIFSIINVPTSAIREMAFKMAHWLKPGGLLVLGSIDFTDVSQAEGWPADPYGEWLNHHFMGQVIKDNVFGVGQWISLLRSADIALVDAQGSVFVAADRGIVMEPEHFFIGRKGDKKALMGPFRPSTTSGMGFSPYIMTNIEQQVVAGRDELARLLDGESDVVDISNRRIKNNEIFTMAEVTPENGTPPHNNGSAPQDNSYQPSDATNRAPMSHHLQHHPDSRIVIMIQPAPFNVVITILNHVASSFNLCTLHAGAKLRAAAAQLQSTGYTHIQTHLLGDEYLDFSSSKNVLETAVNVLIQAFPAQQKQAGREMIELLLKAQLERYLASQRHCGGRADRIGFQRVVLIARR